MVNLLGSGFNCATSSCKIVLFVVVESQKLDCLLCVEYKSTKKTKRKNTGNGVKDRRPENRRVRHTRKPRP